ncbi:hypothetical protein Ancab_005736 [Ancistrocladus abbreviatus]
MGEFLFRDHREKCQLVPHDADRYNQIPLRALAFQTTMEIAPCIGNFETVGGILVFYAFIEVERGVASAVAMDWSGGCGSGEAILVGEEDFGGGDGRVNCAKEDSKEKDFDIRRGFPQVGGGEGFWEGVGWTVGGSNGGVGVFLRGEREMERVGKVVGRGGSEGKGRGEGGAWGSGSGCFEERLEVEWVGGGGAL